MKIVTVVGARPQFIKAAAVSRVINKDYPGQIEEVMVHTGQHFDANMSDVFFEELDIPQPKHNLQISGGGHGEMTGKMLGALERVLIEEKPDWVLVYGDTNSTLAGALAAVKLHIPVAHVEAGLRSFNMKMPEEINRIVADRVSSLLLCPTAVAVENLKREGRTAGVFNAGDVMYDTALFMRERAKSLSTILSQLGLQDKGYVLSTCHRAENTDDKDRLTSLLRGLGEVAKKLPVVLPLHPRTRKIVPELGLASLLEGIKIVDPVSYVDMVELESHAAAIATDSGGVQKEAFFYGVPCITLRDETEWVETVQAGWNRLAPPGKADIGAAILDALGRIPQDRPACYGEGAAAAEIVRILLATPPTLATASEYAQ